MNTTIIDVRRLNTYTGSVSFNLVFNFSEKKETSRLYNRNQKETFNINFCISDF